MTEKHRQALLFICISTFFMLVSGCRLAGPSLSEPDPKRRALVFGVADYRPPLLNDLDYTDDDARDMADMLTQKGYSVNVFYDETTKTRMLNEIEAVGNVSSDRDILIVHFSGHGDGYLRRSPSHEHLADPYLDFSSYPESKAAVIPNTEPGDNTLEEEDVLFTEELLIALDAVPGFKILILDICHAGGFIPSDGVTVDLLPDSYGYIPDQSPFEQAWEAYVNGSHDLSYQNTRVLAGAGSQELAYEAGSIENGWFTYYLLESIGFNHETRSIEDSEMTPADKNRDGAVTVTELYAETFERFQTAVRDGMVAHPYYAHLSGSPYDIVLFQ